MPNLRILPSERDTRLLLTLPLVLNFGSLIAFVATTSVSSMLGRAIAIFGLWETQQLWRLAKSGQVSVRGVTRLWSQALSSAALSLGCLGYALDISWPYFLGIGVLISALNITTVSSEHW